ncbi:hypothetical protein TNCV_2760871 [Trichonephila clavipes]|nr:hypothetical protein TNCV_2760871 [Trichonephila clavipes]
MSVKRFLKLEKALKLLNSLDSDESDVEIAMLPPNYNDEDEGDENGVNTDEITENDVPGSLEVSNNDGVKMESTVLSHRDLVPSNFRIFPKLARHLQGRRFQSAGEVKSVSQVELKGMFKNRFQKRFDELYK